MSSNDAGDLRLSRRVALAGLIACAAGSAPARAAPDGVAVSTPAPGAPWMQLPPTPAWPPPDASGMLDIDGAKIFHASFGKGPAVLLLHGGMGSSDYWGNQIRHLADRYTVLAMDTRGHGRSPFDGAPLSYALFARDAVRLLDAIGLRKASVVGWSDGAITGFELAMRHPDRIERLFAFAGNVSRSAMQRCAGGCPTFVAYAKRCKVEYASLSPEPERWPAFMKSLRAMWRRQQEFERSALARIRTPTLVVDGQYDEIIKPSHAAQAARLIPDARSLLLPHVSHFAMLQDPPLFDMTLDRFLAKPV